MSKFNVFTELKKRERGQKLKIESNPIVNKDLGNLGTINNLLHRFHLISEDGKKINVPDTETQLNVMRRLNLEKSRLEFKLRLDTPSFGQRGNQDELKHNLNLLVKRMIDIENNFNRNNNFIERIRDLRDDITNTDQPERDRVLETLRNYENRLINFRGHHHREIFPQLEPGGSDWSYLDHQIFY